MSDYSFEDTSLEKNPDFELARVKFLLTLPEYKDDSELKAQLVDAIRTFNMTPWYERVCADLQWNCDAELLADMKASNEEALAKFDEAIEDAITNLSVIEVKEAYLRKANYLSLTGDKENTLKVLSQAYGRTVALGYRFDNILHRIRIGFFFLDLKLIKQNLVLATELVEEGADFDRRNRLKIYKGLYCLAIRDFRGATDNFLSTLNTFMCNELMSYNNFLRNAVYASMLTLSRNELRDKIIKNSDISEALYSDTGVKEYLFTFYDCKYAEFFKSLAEVETIFRHDYILNPHFRFYVREMRILAYGQLLTSYKSLTLEYMAEQFGVSKEFIEKELSQFIAAGRLNCIIDKMKDIVLTSETNSKSEQFKNVIKQGDILLNRVQKLTRVINI